MEKSKILAVGCGGCGNKMLSVLMDLDVRYTGIFMNTNLNEMSSCRHFDRERRCFYIANADGSGKNRSLTESYIKEEAPKFVEMIQKFVNQNYIIFLTSGNGGTGSKAVIMLAKLVKKFCPEKSLNLVSTFPNLSESDIDFENAIDFWNEVIELKNKKIFDSIQYIDNNKSFSEEEINVRAMNELNDGFDIVGGKIDSTDSKRVHSTNGYKVVLKLDNSVQNIKDAIDKAIKTSVYFIPDNFECDNMLANINTDTFKMSDVKSEIEAYDFVKFNENDDKYSTIILGGCEMPKEAIELEKEALKEIKNKKRRRVVEEDVVIKRNREELEVSAEKETEAKSKYTSKDLNDLFADDSFWDN
jgi:cell division GTPase FtsZ